jgi:hypothetical protein
VLYLIVKYCGLTGAAVILEETMKNVAKLFLLATVLSLALNGCGPSPSSTVTATVTIPTTALPTLTTIPPTPTPRPTPQGKTIIVTNIEDTGSGTLREALIVASPGDIITFDPSVFPVDDPQIVYLQSPLPGIVQGYVTVDASMAGVVLDGGNIPGDWESAIQVFSNNNIIRGLTILNLSGAAIQISGGQDNLIEDNVIGSSDAGIGMWGADTSSNRITANYIGVMRDGVTPQGNKNSGITIMEGAHNNLIGPGNQIAFNARNGVAILHAGTTGNTVFQNSIHDNGTNGIDLKDGGNGNLAAPTLMDFDLNAGNLSGVACPGCELMVYSDTEAEGSRYEGSTIADNQGVFSFEKGSAFSGPALTATATDLQGNTSGFSVPTTGNRLSMQIQSGNIQPRNLLVSKPSGELEENRIGSLWSDFWQPVDFQAVIDNEILPAGLKWVKITMNQGEYYTNETSGVKLEWDKPELFISPEFDGYIDQLVSHKITIDYVLNFWDKANHPNGWDVKNRFKTEEDIAHYLEYVRFIVSHFKGRVQYYELWNEPNIRVPLQHIEPADYINLAKRTIPVIKQIDPQAKVVVGCTSGSANPNSRDYLFEILNSDVMPIADVVSWHPLFGNIPGEGQFPDFYASYPSLMANIMDTAKKNGFQGEFIATEINYGGSMCGGCDTNDPSYSELVWAKYLARGIILHLGNDIGAGVGGMTSQRRVYYDTIRNIANVFAGVHAEKFAIEVQTESTNFKAFTFSGTDGSRLVALWTDGAAVDDDPGVASTITIPGFAGWNATGIDMLNGFEQKLTTSTENGNLIIRDLLIKDYPIIIRLSK